MEISAPERFLRMEAVPSIFWQNTPNIGEETKNRPVFFKVLSNQLPSYYSWNLDPNSLVTNAFQRKWYHNSPYAFPPFSLIQKVPKKVEEENVHSLILVTLTWQTQSWYPELLLLSVKSLIILPQKEYLLKGSQNQQYPLIQN